MIQTVHRFAKSAGIPALFLQGTSCGKNATASLLRRETAI
jgi:hypothetical protein